MCNRCAVPSDIPLQQNVSNHNPTPGVPCGKVNPRNHEQPTKINAKRRKGNRRRHYRTRRPNWLHSLLLVPCCAANKEKTTRPPIAAATATTKTDVGSTTTRAGGGKTALRSARDGLFGSGTTRISLCGREENRQPNETQSKKECK